MSFEKLLVDFTKNYFFDQLKSIVAAFDEEDIAKLARDIKTLKGCLDYTYADRLKSDLSALENDLSMINRVIEDAIIFTQIVNDLSLDHLNHLMVPIPKK